MNTRFGEPLAAGALESPAAERNKQPLLEVLQPLLPAAGSVLEIAAGTGQHAAHFARALPALTWQPSDPDPKLRAAIAARVAAAALPNLLPPLALDVLDRAWPALPVAVDAVFCSNMIHIAPWAATDGLLRHAAALLAHGAPLILYGPYTRDGLHTAPSNEAFDASLRARNAEWGVRDLGEVTALAERYGFTLREAVAMPANNQTVTFTRS